MEILHRLLDTLGPAGACHNAAAALDARRADEQALDAALERLELRDRRLAAAA